MEACILGRRGGPSQYWPRHVHPHRYCRSVYPMERHGLHEQSITERLVWAKTLL